MRSCSSESFVVSHDFVIVLVFVLVREKRSALTRLVCSQRLEGSRFGMYPATLANFASALIWPKRAKTGGSRE
jgi:hypothetical protein